MKTKTLAIVTVLAMALGIFPGTTPAAPTEKKVVIKLGHVEPEDRSTHKATVKFKQYVEEQSAGKIAVEIYPNGQLGGDRQETEAVALGTIADYHSSNIRADNLQSKIWNPRYALYL